MDNYVYIVASLPDLTAGFENTSFDYAATKEFVMEQLSEKDQKLVEFSRRVSMRRLWVLTSMPKPLRARTVSSVSISTSTPVCVT